MDRRHHRSRLLAALAAVAASGLLVGAGPVFGVTLAPEPVHARSDRQERMPAGDGGWVTWSQSVDSSAWDYNVYAQKGSAKPVKVSRRSSAEDDGWSVGPLGGGIDGSRIVYTERGLDFAYDLYVFDLSSGRRTRLPKAVNSDTFELHPTISGAWVLFGRDSGFRTWVFLYNLRTLELRLLARTREESGYYVEPGQVNGRFATWSRWGGPDDEGNVFRYDIRTKVSTKIPRPIPFTYQGDSSVGVDGTVYYERSSPSCGYDAELARYPVGGPAESLHAFPPGHDMGSTFVDDRPDGSRAVFAEVTTCGGGYDAVRFPDRFGLTVTRAGTGSGVVVSQPAGINCGEDCEEVFSRRLTVTLTAAPSPGSRVTQWSEPACGGQLTCAVPVRAAERVSVTFSDGS